MNAQPAPDPFAGPIGGQLDALIANLTSNPPPLAAPVAPPRPEPVLETCHPDQLEDVLTVLNAAAAWLVDRGIEQWPASFDEGNHRVDKLRAQAEQGHVYVVRLGRYPIATATITPWADPDFAAGWPPGTVDDALYVYRLASTRTARNLAWKGAWLLDFATQLAQEQGKKWIRVDCSRQNEGLHSYYLRLGFKPMGVQLAVDQRTGRPRKSGALFQRDVPPAPRPEGDWA